jgi:PIN domain nuclease of toxin-antitoxin system
VKYLLDTHVLLWWLDDHSPLSSSARQTINHERNEIFVSAASLWEIAIKKNAGKLTAPDDLLTILQQSRMSVLPINAQHAMTAGALPDHHSDPFDRMLIAQAMIEDLTIMTHDKVMQTYNAACLMV